MAVPARTVLENGPRIRPCPHKTKYIRSPRPEVRNVPTPTLMLPADRPESNAAHTAAFPPRLGQGPRLAHVSLRAMEWPFRRTTTSKHGDWARRRPTSGHPRRPPGSVHASGPGYGKPSTSPAPPGAPSPWSPLPAAGCVTWPGPTQPLPRWWCWPRPTTSCWTRPAPSPLRAWAYSLPAGPASC
jgi:hypothetical protein